MTITRFRDIPIGTLFAFEYGTDAPLFGKLSATEYVKG